MRLWIFDLDGTLVDTSGDIVLAAGRLLEEHGRPPMDRDDVMRHVGFGTPHLVAALLGLPLLDPLVPAAAARFVEIYSEDPTGRSAVYPGTAETLDRLSSRDRLAVVSNKAGPLVRATLEAVHMARLFAFAWGGQEFGRLKPAPDGLLMAMALSQIPAAQTTMVGDMPMDVRAGRDAGVRTLFAEYGFGRLGPEDPVPDGTLDSLPRILEWS